MIDNSTKVILDGFETKYVGVIPCLMSSKLCSVLGETRVYLVSPQSQKVSFGNSCSMTDNSTKVVLDGFETKYVGVIPCLMSSKLCSVLGETRVHLVSPQSQKVSFGNSW